MRQNIRLALAGGGTGGHIVPNIALIQELRSRYASPQGETMSSEKPSQGLELLYFGSTDGMEKEMIAKLDVPYKAILCGKWRRYFSWQNFIDFFKVPLGIIQATIALARFKPQAVFCKGGYVSFPVAFAGWLLRIPVILHESDLVPGLSNKMCARFATKICVSFEESKKYFSEKKVVVTGTPVRSDLVKGSKDEGRKFTGMNESVPVLLFMGGSQGADFINNLVWVSLQGLLTHYQVVHICGENKCKEPDEVAKLLQKNYQKYLPRYRAFGFVDNEMKHLYALTDMIITRSGANTLAEIEAVHKPAILIPLSKKASRGDQIDNAKAFAQNHSTLVMEEEDFKKEKFFEAIEKLLYTRTHDRVDKITGCEATEKIIHLLESV